MNIELHLLLSSSLIVAWGAAVVMTNSIQQRNAVPEWIENARLVGLLSPGYYVVAIGTLAYYLALPIMTRSLLVLLLTLVPATAVYLMTFTSRYNTGTVRTTANGRALSVALFGILAVIILPIAILWFKAR